MNFIRLNDNIINLDYVISFSELFGDVGKTLIIFRNGSRDSTRYNIDMSLDEVYKALDIQAKKNV